MSDNGSHADLHAHDLRRHAEPHFEFIREIHSMTPLINKLQFPYQSWCFLEFSYSDCAAEFAFVYLQSSLTH